MRVRGKLLRDVEPSDIVDLVTDGAPETVTLDYKEKITDAQEFAKDVAAFANTSGGVLLYGIAERPEDVERIRLETVGVEKTGADDLLRLEQVIRDHTDPHLTGCDIRSFTPCPWADFGTWLISYQGETSCRPSSGFPRRDGRTGPTLMGFCFSKSTRARCAPTLSG